MRNKPLIPNHIAKDLKRIADFCEMPPADLLELLLESIDPVLDYTENLRAYVPNHLYESKAKALAAGRKVWGEGGFKIFRKGGAWRVDDQWRAQG